MARKNVVVERDDERFADAVFSDAFGESLNLGVVKADGVIEIVVLGSRLELGEPD